MGSSADAMGPGHREHSQGSPKGMFTSGCWHPLTLTPHTPTTVEACGEGLVLGWAAPCLPPVPSLPAPESQWHPHRCHWAWASAQASFPPLSESPRPNSLHWTSWMTASAPPEQGTTRLCMGCFIHATGERGSGTRPPLQKMVTVSLSSHKHQLSKLSS